ncbi:MAG: hypothetical protein ACHQ2Z_11265, partial [Elusimicrobiota bacterium]
FDVDAERDWFSALLIARGIELPVLGPAVVGNQIYLGPLYYLFTAVAAAWSEAPSAFIFLSVSAQLAALWIAAGFLRRAFGSLAACIFAALWGLLPYLIDASTHLTHDYLGIPLVAALLWVCWDMQCSQDDEHLPLAALLVGVAAQLYAVNGVFLGLLLVLVVMGRVGVKPRQALVAAGVFALTQIFTIASWFPRFAVREIFRQGIGASLGAGRNFWRILWPLFSYHGVPRAGMLIATGFFFIGLWRARRGPRPEACARAVIAAAFLITLVTAVVARDRFAERYLVIFLPMTLMMPAVGLNDLFQRIRWGWVRWLLVLSLAVPLIRVSGGPAAAPRRAGAFLGRADRSVVALAARAHAADFASPYLQLLALAHTRDDIPDASATDVFLATDADGEAEGGTRLIAWRSGDRRARAIFYRTSLDRAGATVFAGAAAQPKSAFDMGSFPVPYRPFVWRRASLLFTRQAAGLETTVPVVREPGLGSHVRIVMPRDGPLSLQRRIMVVTGGPCRVSAVERARLVPLRCRPGAGESSSQVCIMLPARRPGPVVLDLDTASCTFSHFDMFDLPLK